MSDLRRIKVKVTIEGEYNTCIDEIVSLISSINYGPVVSDGITSIDINLDVNEPIEVGD